MHRIKSLNIVYPFRIQIFQINTFTVHQVHAFKTFNVFAVPQQGILDIWTEFGKMVVSPGEICGIQVGNSKRADVEGGRRTIFTTSVDNLIVMVMSFVFGSVHSFLRNLEA
jgi:homogentisate 1,2-dioxygenase